MTRARTDPLKEAEKLARKQAKAAEQVQIRQWCERNGLPVPTFEHTFDLEREWRFDVAWPQDQVALEIEGNIWRRGRHTRGGGFLKDAEKYNQAVSQGWLVLRVARPPQARKVRAVLFHPDVVEWIRQAIWVKRDLPR